MNMSTNSENSRKLPLHHLPQSYTYKSDHNGGFDAQQDEEQGSEFFSLQWKVLKLECDRQFEAGESAFKKQEKLKQLVSVKNKMSLMG